MEDIEVVIELTDAIEAEVDNDNAIEAAVFPEQPIISLTDPTIVTRIAYEDLNGQKVVAVRSDGYLVLADNNDAAHVKAVVGVTIGAAEEGASAYVKALGTYTEPGWAWTPGTALFLGTNGALVSEPPATGFILCVGYAITATTIFIQIQTPLVRV